MKIKALRMICRNADNIEEGQVIDLPDDEAQWWIEQGFGEAFGYETKPHPAHPMQAGGRVKPQSSPPPARRSRRRKSKPAEGSD